MRFFAVPQTVVLAVGLLWPASRLSAQNAASNLHDFGEIRIEAPVQHTFEFHNDRPDALVIQDVKLTPPLVVTKMTSRVDPGKNGSVTVSLGEHRRKGQFKGAVIVNFSNEGAKPLTLWVRGVLVPPIEFDPFARFFISVQRGEEKTSSIDITSHEPEPFEILNVFHNSSRFTTELKTLEAGRRFRLTLKVKPDAPAGTESEDITLNTTSAEYPNLIVKANVKVHERVYTFPDKVLMEISTRALKARPQMVGSLRQELTVYQKRGTNFQVFSAQTDVPFLRLTAFQAHLKDRFGIKIEVIPEKLKAGKVDGSIFIATNDPQFPRLTVPVSAVVEEDW